MSNKLKLNIKTTPQIRSIYPTNHCFTMRNIASRGSGKTTFLIAFLWSLVYNKIIKEKDIYILFYISRSVYVERFRTSRKKYRTLNKRICRK